MGLRPGQVLVKLNKLVGSDATEAEWIGIEKSDGYKVLKDRYGNTGHADELPEYAQNPEIVTLR